MSKNKEYIWYNDISKKFMGVDYLLPGQSLDDRVWIIANTAEKILGIEGYAEKFVSYMKKGWYSLSTPIWTNFGSERGMPISCFGSHISDSVSSILKTNSEVGMMTKLGGGTSAYFGDLRGRGSEIKNNGKSSGAVHAMKMYENCVNVISQGSMRRGNFAAYLPIEHPDAEEFLKIRSDGNPLQDILFGITVSDQWLQEMKDGDRAKRKLWGKVIESRMSIGLPYIMFTDNVNNNTVDVYKDKGKKITHSNLCSEIMLADDEDESFVCDLSSMNISYYDEWKNTDAVEILTFLLDAVMTEFIDKAREEYAMERAVKFAENQRALGVGWLGWHTYLQKKHIAFESMEAKMLNVEIAKTIHDQTYTASEKLAQMYGEPELLKGYGRRNVTLMAIAPTKSSSVIIGQVSEGIEPHRANYYIKDTAKGKFSIKNPQLEAHLEKLGHNTREVWESILANAGSVQHLDFLSQEDKDVFKTFSEISMREVIIQAGARQKYIDQGQSLNIMVHPTTKAKDVNALILFAHEQGVKSLYYQYSVNAAQEFSKNLNECVSCSA